MNGKATLPTKAWKKEYADLTTNQTSVLCIRHGLLRLGVSRDTIASLKTISKNNLHLVRNTEAAG